MTINRRPVWVIAVCIALVLSVGPGCAEHARVGAGASYPLDKKQTETVDIQVIREETSITFTNTTARRLPPATMWINGQYSAPIGALEVGETRTLDLASFRNEFGESFRAGGFFATSPPDVVVQVQLELEDRMVGLVAVREVRR